MLNRIFPAEFDHCYRGNKIAYWLLIPILLMKTVIGINSIVIGRTVAQSADGIPLDTFTAHGAEAVVSLFALWGLSQLMLCGVGILAVIRYRSMVPLIYLLLLVEAVGRRWILFVKPIVKTGTTAGAPINLILIALMILGLVLSLRGERGLASNDSKSA
jgi:hypothetical protein